MKQKLCIIILFIFAILFKFIREVCISLCTISIFFNLKYMFHWFNLKCQCAIIVFFRSLIIFNYFSHIRTESLEVTLEWSGTFKYWFNKIFKYCTICMYLRRYRLPTQGKPPNAMWANPATAWFCFPSQNFPHSFAISNHNLFFIFTHCHFLTLKWIWALDSVK